MALCMRISSSAMPEVRKFGQAPCSRASPKTTPGGSTDTEARTGTLLARVADDHTRGNTDRRSVSAFLRRPRRSSLCASRCPSFGIMACRASRCVAAAAICNTSQAGLHTCSSFDIQMFRHDLGNPSTLGLQQIVSTYPCGIYPVACARCAQATRDRRGLHVHGCALPQAVPQAER